MNNAWAFAAVARNNKPSAALGFFLPTGKFTFYLQISDISQLFITEDSLKGEVKEKYILTYEKNRNLHVYMLCGSKNIFYIL